MKLSELKTGTPIRIRAFSSERKVGEIWGKIRKNSNEESQIDIYYYEGGNIDLNSPAYEIQAVAFANGEHEVEWNNRKVSGMEQEEERLVENRDAFRIYIGVPAECTIQNMETVALLVDMSEGGFRIMLRDFRAIKAGMPVVVEIEDADFSFEMNGKVVWGKEMDDIKSVYGCIVCEGTDKDVMKAYMKKKQEKLFEELQKEISEEK